MSVVGSITVLLGGFWTSSLWGRIKVLPLYLIGIDGMISSVFVLLMIFSRSAAGGSEDKGFRIFYGTMSEAYLTAELWLGALNNSIALLPPQYKTLGLSMGRNPSPRILCGFRDYWFGINRCRKRQSSICC